MPKVMPMNNKEYVDFILNQTIGILIRKEREKNNLTLDQLAKKSGVSKQNIYYYEIARNRVKLDKFLKICEALDLNPSEIFDKIALEYIKMSKGI